MELHRAVYDILKKRNLSYLRLAKMLSYGSATSIARLLDGKTTLDSFHAFVARLLSLEELELTEEEKLSLNIPENEAASSVFCQKLWNLLTRKDSDNFEDVSLRDVSSGESLLLSSLLRSNPQCELELVNIVSSNLSLLLRSLAKECGFHVRSYGLKSDSINETIASIEGFFHVQGLPWFSQEIIDPAKMRISRGLLSGKFAVLRGRKDYLLIPESTTAARMLPLSREEADGLRKMVFEGAEYRSMQNPESETQDYTKYLSYCARLEKNNTIFQIKPEFGIEQIPVQVQMAAAKRGPLAGAGEEIAVDLVNLQQQRFDNLHTMRHNQYRFYTRHGFETFAAGGRTTDHFWGYDSFTPAERMLILSDILRQTSGNPRYCLRFFKDDIRLNFNEITRYEHNGVFLILPVTHYDLETGSTETNFFNEAFERFLTQTFRKWLQKDKLTSKEETEALLREYIARLG